MILKQLELSGFKSFADPTHLDFTRGFTAVVGPNGCGKSNVSDAIRWVIGEQSSKHLRGTRIADLIFNGSDSRKPVNRAEVSMTLADVPPGLRIANIPNLSEEIKVTRCYHRSGESEFYINQVPCRLKDITDLFLDIGISPKVLTVIEQGNIQDIVTSKPDDRRMWIEEAAGVLKFKARKNEALRKLDAAGQNLDRISDIVQELSRQVESLKRQAAKAERYKQYQAEIKELSLDLFSRRIRRAERDLEEIDQRHKARTEQKTEWNAQASTLETDIETLKFEIDELATELNHKKETVHSLNTAIGKNEHNIELKQGEMKRARQDIESAVGEVESMNAEIAQNQSQCGEQRAEGERLTTVIAEKEQSRQALQQQYEQTRNRLNELDGQVKQLDRQIMERVHHISRKKNELTALETRRQGLTDRDQRLETELNEVTGQIAALQTALSEADTGYREKAEVFERLQREQEQLTQRAAELKQRLDQQEEAAHAARERYLAQNSLLQSMQELRRKFEGFGDGVRALMANGAGEHVNGLHDVLVDVVKAPAEFEAAVEAVMGEKLQSMIVDSYTDSVEAIRYLDQNKSGRGSFIPLQPKSAVRPPLYMNGNQGVIGRLADLIQTREEYRPILNHLLGHVVLVRDLETALQLHGHSEFQGSVVTLKGEVIDDEGVVTGGAQDDNDAGLLSRNREMEELTATVADLKQEMDALQGEALRMETDLATLQEQVQAGSKAVHAADIERTHRYNELEQMKKEAERLSQKRSTIEYERTSGQQQLQGLAREQEALQETVTTAEAEQQSAETMRESQSRELALQREELDRKGQEANQLNVEITSLKGKAENLLLEVKRLEQQSANLAERIARRQEDSRSNTQKITECEEAIKGYEQAIMEQVREKGELSQVIVSEEETLNEKEETLDAHEKQARELVKQIQEITEEISQIELKRSETRIQIAHIEEKVWEDFHVSVDEMKGREEKDIDEDVASEQLAGLKDKVAKMGEVNLAALSDFQKANERYLFLQKQEEDLAESILSLHQTIEKIDKTTRQLFADTFELVNERFKANFERLFSGGRAELIMLDPSDPLESGIDIKASPPGKTMQNIQLLSGGEKAMTAISLLFAILQVRPSPFCLLDEVDAPLDEANVTRFQDMLSEMADKTQFIMITHNQKTMSFADTLYGVTMEERGASKVVSVHLNN
ncbi:chromosome segregation protein [Nitrospina gracilis]|nr:MULTISPECIES: chromosome segregation protein SMC [Nitrospina]MCF8722900.1 chromosome segregation protein [Nitrospina sp. Nb-3]